MVDVAVLITVGGEHVANFFSGQQSLEEIVKTALIWFVLCLASIEASQAADQNMAWHTVKTGFRSKYLGSSGGIAYKWPIYVNEIIIGYKDWYGGIWNSTGLGNTKYGQTYGDEFDFYGGWAHTYDRIKLDISATYWAIATLDETGDDLWVFEPEISFPKCPFAQPYIRGRYYGRVGSQSAKPGFFWFAGLRKGMLLGKGAADRSNVLNLQASTAYAAGALRDSTGFLYGRLTISLDAPLSKHWTLNPTIIYQVAAPGQLSDTNGFVKGNQFVYSISLVCKY